MGNTTDDFGKKRDHNQYGEIDKSESEKNNTNLPKMPNKGTSEEE